MAWIHNARIAAIFAVVLLHVAGPPLAEGVFASPMWWASAFMNSATRWGVPMFAMLSGGVLLGQGRSEETLLFYRKRMARVLVPLLSWSLIYLLWRLGKRALNNQAFDWPELGWLLISGQPYYHLWFLYMILGLYLLTPFLRLLFERASDHQILQLVGLLFVMVAANTLYGAVWQTQGKTFLLVWCFDYLPYFLFGGWLVRWQGPLPNKALCWNVAALGLAITFSGYTLSALKGNRGMMTYFLENLSFGVIIGSLALILLLRQLKYPFKAQVLSALTFGIYLVHPMILELFRKVTSFQVFAISGFLYAGVLLAVALLVFVLSAFFVWLVSKFPYLRRLI